MSKLNTKQKEILATIPSNKIRKKLKKEFKKSNKEQPFEDTRSFLENYFATATNPLFGDFRVINTSDGDGFKGILHLPNANSSKIVYEPLKTNALFTKEQMEKCFNESRLTTHPLTASFKHENLASYLKTLEDEK